MNKFIDFIGDMFFGYNEQGKQTISEVTGHLPDPNISLDSIEGLLFAGGAIGLGGMLAYCYSNKIKIKGVYEKSKHLMYSIHPYIPNIF